MPPTVSIIIPVYRTPEQLLRRCLASVLGQTGVEVEVIAVDDASPDGCPSILDEIAAQDSRLRVIHRAENGRAGAARNDGLARARGAFVLFADADDSLQPDMCVTLVDLGQKHAADIVACSWSEVTEEGHATRVCRLDDRVYDLNRRQDCRCCFRSLTYALWNKLFRRDALADLRFESFEANIGEDTLFNVAALCECRRMVATSYVGYAYTVHSASATGRSAKGVSYLQTLAESGRRIKQTILAKDAGSAGRELADMMLLKRFSTGCGWIAKHPDPDQRMLLWNHWLRYFRDELAPSLDSHSLLTIWYRFACRIGDARIAYRLTWTAARLSDRLVLGKRHKRRDQVPLSS